LTDESSGVNCAIALPTFLFLQVEPFALRTCEAGSTIAVLLWLAFDNNSLSAVVDLAQEFCLVGWQGNLRSSLDVGEVRGNVEQRAFLAKAGG
jgi:hypothetical protein